MDGQAKVIQEFANGEFHDARERIISLLGGGADEGKVLAALNRAIVVLLDAAIKLQELNNKVNDLTKLTQAQQVRIQSANEIEIKARNYERVINNLLQGLEHLIPNN